MCVRGPCLCDRWLLGTHTNVKRGDLGVFTVDKGLRTRTGKRKRRMTSGVTSVDSARKSTFTTVAGPWRYLETVDMGGKSTSHLRGPTTGSTVVSRLFL